MKIPYRMYYIFKAIFEIVDELKKEHPLPKDVECFLGKYVENVFTRRRHHYMKNGMKAMKQN